MITLFKDSLKIIILSIVVSFSVFLVLAQGGWVEPTVAPPGGNVAAPLNTGSTGQSKSGGLILNTGGATNGLIVQSGNVGIGTTSPYQTLSVAGNVNIAGNLTLGTSILFPNGSVQTVAASSTGRWVQVIEINGTTDFTQNADGLWNSIPQTNVTITISNSRVLVKTSGSAKGGGGSSIGSYLIRINRDNGSEIYNVGEFLARADNTYGGGWSGEHLFTGLSPGTHNFTIQVKAFSMNFLNRSLTYPDREVRRITVIELND